MLAGKRPGDKVGWPSADQVEIGRLTSELEIAGRRLATTRSGPWDYGKSTRAWSRSPRARTSMTGDANADNHSAGLDPARGDLFAAWITKELLRKVMACKYRGGLRYQISAARAEFYPFAAV